MLQLCPKETQRKNKSLTRVKSIIKKPSCCWETTNAWKEPRKKKELSSAASSFNQLLQWSLRGKLGWKLNIIEASTEYWVSRASWQALRLRTFRFSTGYRLVAKWLFSGVARILLAGKKTAVLRVSFGNDPQWEASLQIFSFNWLCGCQRRRVFFEPCSSHSAWVYVICVIYKHCDPGSQKSSK